MSPTVLCFYRLHGQFRHERDGRQRLRRRPPGTERRHVRGRLLPGQLGQRERAAGPGPAVSRVYDGLQPRRSDGRG